MMISIFGQWSGNGLGYFNTSLYNVVGVKSKSEELLYNMVTQICQCTGAVSAALLSDKMPRRKVLVPGTFGMLPFPFPGGPFLSLSGSTYSPLSLTQFDSQQFVR
jgi:Sugar (and other) transporter